MSAPSDPTSTDSAPTDAAVADSALVDLLGLVAFGELLAFERMAADARLAPDLPRRAALGEMAAAEIRNYRRLADRLGELGVLPDDAMEVYVEPLQAYHDSTEPKDWAEAVTKAYVGDAITDDFIREIADVLAEPDRGLVLEVLHESRYAEFAAAEIRAAIEADPRVANRLSMWARRLVGEALSQAGRVASADRGALTALIARGEQVDVPGLFRRLTAAHTARMAAVGLNN
ncbi:ferritin-like fold-containing protein [Micromonospora thermarum]|uniref:Hydroxylase n=1 Tax=Micromonospora thermarum TaxID=2720024 RepID=A0ABX0Z5Y0_9ACTN|nr:ferritin-like fold-containing protein [Micromonospora thermarum]NJP31355.1 hydroxylase [Micromonospora thermarum]